MSHRTPAVLLISPGILRWVDMDFGLPHLVSMGGYVRAHTGVRVELLDLNYEGGDHRDLARTLDALGPFLLIGLSCYSSFDYMRVMTLARYLRQTHPDVPLITGGYHASALPGDVVFDGSPFDAVIVGEGEEPLRRMVEGLLGGEPLTPGVHQRDLLPELDALPMYQWDLLDRYWPHAHAIGRKFQIYLSRGCPYRCSFCMERAKSGYSWRSYSPERAVAELERLGTYTDLSRWLINVADPLFGFRRRWRREVLEGIARKGLFPRQYWTLTRSDDLDDTDLSLLAEARFSIGIGLESGSPSMLKRMQKGNRPERYLDAVRHLARGSHRHGLTWAVNVIVGHPGETPASLAETHAFVSELFAGPGPTRGWLSVDPFRLYPGSLVHLTMDAVEADTGARFHHRDWWRSWYDGPFRAQHLEPSGTLSYAERVRFMFDRYQPLVADIAARFQGQGRDIDRVFARSAQEQVDTLTPARRDQLIGRGRQATGRPATAASLPIPFGMRLKDPWVRRREEAVRQLLGAGTLRSEAVIEALLHVGPEAWLPSGVAEALLAGRAPSAEREGLPAPSLPLSLLATCLEALEPEPRHRVADLAACSGYLAALLRQLVGAEGQVVALPGHPTWAARLREQLSPLGVEVRDETRETLTGTFDRLVVPGALPRFPGHLGRCLADDGRAAVFLGPRFRPQDLVVVRREGSSFPELPVVRARVDVLAGPDGWLRHLPAPRQAPRTVFDHWRGSDLWYHLLAHVDLGQDAANLYRADLPPRPWVSAVARALADPRARLAAHALGLLHAEVDDLDAALQTPPPALREAAPVLREALADLRTETWTPDEDRCGRARREVGGPLDQLRQHLYAPTGAAPPPLRVLHCPALGRHGRATGTRHERRVAVSLDEPASHVLMQVLHEEMHPISDPHVDVGSLPRDTRAGTPGHAVHARLEAVAVGATRAFLAARAPALMRDFVAWTERQRPA